PQPRANSSGPVLVEYVGHGGAEHSAANTVLGGGAVPFQRLIPVLVAELTAGRMRSPMVSAYTLIPRFGIAVVTSRGDLGAAPNRVERRVTPRYRRTYSHNTYPRFSHT